MPGAALRREPRRRHRRAVRLASRASGAGSTACCTRSPTRRARRWRGDYLDTLSREAFAIAHDISSYSFAALAKGARPLMAGRPASLVTLSYLGARALGAELQRDGPRQGEPRGQRPLPGRLPRARGHPRQRHLGRTDQDAGRGGHRRLRQALSRFVERTAPLRRNVTIDEVGNVAAFLLSDLASAITGEITYVDCGFSTVAVGRRGLTGASPGAPPRR